MEVEQVVAAGVVVCRRALPPVGAAAAAVPVPELGHRFEGGGLGAVDRREELRGYRGTPAVPAVRVDAQRLCQQVLLRVYDIDQPAQAGRGVCPEADVYVDTAGAVRSRARRPDGLGDPEYHRDILPAAHRAYDLRAGVGDRAVPLDHPLAPVGHGNVPVTEVAAHVAGSRAEVGGYGLGGTLAPDTRGFQLDTESLATHRGSSFARRLAPPAATGEGCAPPGVTIHHSEGRKKQPDEKHNHF